MDMAEARRTFREVRLAHVASVLADGSPHVVPLWFVWLADGLYVTSRKESRLAQNLAGDPRVSVAVRRGEGWTEQAGVMIRGRASVLPPDHPEMKKALSAWFEKYRSELAGSGFAAYTQQVREPLVISVQAQSLTSWIHASTPHR